MSVEAVVMVVSSLTALVSIVLQLVRQRTDKKHIDVEVANDLWDALDKSTENYKKLQSQYNQLLKDFDAYKTDKETQFNEYKDLMQAQIETLTHENARLQGDFDAYRRSMTAKVSTLIKEKNALEEKIKVLESN